MKHTTWTLLALTLLVALPARAHFILVEPEASTEQDFLGGPQKSPPCGVGDPGQPAVETGVVTYLKSGSILTIAVNETIFHPGHYRIAIAANPESLPDNPPVTPGTTPCGSTTIDDTPELPVLADGLLLHTAPLGGVKTMEVQLPAGFVCDKCTLQVLEFMSEHDLNVPGGCYYHHCATVTVNETGLDADGGTGEPPPPVGCGCVSTESSLLLLVPLMRRRKR